MQHVVFHEITAREGIRLNCGRYLRVWFGSDRKLLKHGFENKQSLGDKESRFFC